MKNLKGKAALMLVVELLCLCVLGMFLFQNQTAASADKYRADIEVKLSQIPELIQQAEATEEQIYLSYDEVFQAKADSLAYMIRNLEDFDMTAGGMEQARELLNVTNALVLDRQGNVLAASDASPADFRRARFNRLREVFSGNVPMPFGVEYASGTRSYFASRIDDASMVVIEQDPSDLDALQAASSGWSSVLGNVHVGLNGYCFAVSDRDYTFLYHPNEALIDSDALYHGVDVSALENGWYGYLTLDGARHYCGVTYQPQSNVYVVCAVNEAEIAGSRSLTVGVVLFVAFAVLTVVITYAILVLKVQQSGDRGEKNLKPFGRLVFDAGLARRVAAICVVGLLLIVGISLYMQTLFSISQHAMSSGQRAAEVEQTLDQTQALAKTVEEQYNARYINKAQIAAHIVGKLPQPITREQLEELSTVIDTEWIILFDQYGTISVSNSPYGHFRLSADPGDQSYAFRQLLNGAPYVIQEAMPDELSGELRQYIGAAINDEEGENRGFVQIAIAPSRLEEALASTSLSSILSGVTTGANGYAFAVSKETGLFSYHPQERLIGRSAFDYGLGEAALQNGYCDYMTVADEALFGSVLETDSDYVIVALPASELNESLLSNALATAGVCLACLVIVVALLTVSRRDEKPVVASGQEQDDDGREGMIDVVMPDGQVKKTESVASRWDNMGVAWESKSPEQQTATIIKWLVGVLAAAICVCMAFGESLMGPDSIFMYVLSDRWQRGFNIFAMTACLIEICLFVVATMLVQWVLRILSNTFDARGETVCRLLRSFVKYISVIAAMYYCLALFGVDTATLLASAGILSLVIGLGAKSLVSDIIAGLFLIFEGEFRVGDIVTVGDWRGTVTEIGVRTTKIEDGAKNVKIISNSNVTGIINMTRKYSMAVCDVGIEYGESLERVENVLSRELPKLQERLPSIRSGPFYKGVKELGDNSVNIRIVAECAEKDRFQLVRDLNREVKLIFDRNEINIPFPQVVLNQPPEFKKVTNREKRQADAFTKEQSELSKDIVDSAVQ